MKYLFFIILAFFSLKTIGQITILAQNHSDVPLNGSITFGRFPQANLPTSYSYTSQPFPGTFQSYRLDKRGTGATQTPYWYIYTDVSSSGVTTKTLLYQSSYNTDSEPPCNDIWIEYFAGVIPLSIRRYSEITISGNSCIQLPISTVGNSSVTTTVNGIIYPVFTSNQLATIPNPVAGLTVFDYSKGYLRTWNGSQWMPL